MVPDLSGSRKSAALVAEVFVGLTRLKTIVGSENPVETAKDFAKNFSGAL